MGSRVGGRVIHFLNLPIKLQMPKTLTNITEFSLKTIPSASKIEIKRVLETLYGFDVDEVRTLNMEGKKKQRGGILLAKPDYKKAYVTLRSPLSVSPDLFPVKLVEEERRRIEERQVKRTTLVGEDGDKVAAPRQWLDGAFRRGYVGVRAEERGRWRKSFVGGGARRGGAGGGGGGEEGKARFPWSSMRGQRNRAG
ncbi:hypothetical protein QJS04_geneDACA023104 [Acorus gramineus]|uniref:Large ribosomal subunit protein uL23m n=1 Tax=Acorus gramineus TaxID=55184 RepID=A0AAV8ZY26_ACOGR|nr:hypothetical protein QJS04_geneDACA023104 [Acorus gramineus]